ncbi:hypothetical protein V8C43DRAFT_70065 [Trichoderma afarasin]
MASKAYINKESHTNPKPDCSSIKIKIRRKEVRQAININHCRPHCHAIHYLKKKNMLTQVIAIEYGSKERLQEILESILGEENFKLVQRVSNQWQIKLIRRLTTEEINEIRLNMTVHYLPSS